jgi:hypothetical protein
MDPMYREMREHGDGRITSFLVATGLWVRWPFRLFFPPVDE